MRQVLLLGAMLLLAACAPSVPTRATPPDITALAQAIAALSPDVDAAEAARAARISFAYSRQLAQEYQITDPPLIHNAKVNAGLRPRGLRYHWAEDMERRLNAEGFTTLELTRAIANSESRFLIEHSTAVIKAKGTLMQDGVVLDPWRHGGRLFWAPVHGDARYAWKPRTDVLRAKGQIRYAQRPDTSVVSLPADLFQE